MDAHSQQAFLHGPPTPLMLTLEGRTESPFELYGKIASEHQPSFLLETGAGRKNKSCYSFLGSHPTAITSRLEDLRLATANPHPQSSTWGKPSGIEPIPNLPPFFGGAVGYISYDFVRCLEAIPSMAADDLQIPTVQFGLFELVTAVDHLHNRIQVIFCPSLERFHGESRDRLYREGIERVRACAATLTGPTRGSMMASMESIPFAAEQKKEEYLDRVRRCQRYIAQGDIYQANLSHRFSFEIPAAYQTGAQRLQYEQSLFHHLRMINPSPFSSLLRFDKVSLICCSPERLVRLQGGRAETRPIAGTRPRGENISEDRALVEELLTNDKERAEHLMLVDLERNDLGRVCEFGTVVVDEFMAVEQYSHVNHIVSNVSGAIRQDVTPFDVIKATFPGGTITGVPKVRCMEIIEELEPVRRGPYTGSLGYIGWNGDLDLNIIIRTLVLTGHKGYLQVGAGVVADSIPDREYEETLHKAQSFFTSLGQNAPCGST